MAFFVGDYSVLSYNVVSLRSIIKKHDLIGMLKGINADIVFFQEIKVGYEHIPSIEEKLREIGYQWHFWNLGPFGVSAHCKYKPLSWEVPKSDVFLGRLIILHYTDLKIINVYAQNAGDKLKNMDKKIRWNQELNELLGDGSLLLCGDLNVANEDMDIWVTNPKALKQEAKVPGFSPIEREAFKEMLKEHRLVDLWRQENPKVRGYTYYGNIRGHNKEFFEGTSNKGWRIDYFLLRGPKDPSYSVKHLKRFGSDHLPIILDVSVKAPFEQMLTTVKYEEIEGTRIYRQGKKVEGVDDKPLYRMFEYADYHRHRMYIAYQNAEKSYQFMSFRDANHFETYYKGVPYKSHYEVIRDSSMCKLYFDIDFPHLGGKIRSEEDGEDEPTSNTPIRGEDPSYKKDPGTLDLLVNKLLESFDVSDILIKKSQKGYHVVCNKWYQSNESMKSFVNSIGGVNVDMKVYTKNRLMRILYSSKFGKKDPFSPIDIMGKELQGVKASEYFIA